MTTMKLLGKCGGTTPASVGELLDYKIINAFSLLAQLQQEEKERIMEKMLTPSDQLIASLGISLLKICYII